MDKQSFAKSNKAEFSGTIKISNQAINDEKLSEKKKIEISSGSNLEIVASNTGILIIIITFSS